jgi:hypothetical protein
MNDNEVSAFNVGHVSSNSVFPAPGRPVYLLLVLAERISSSSGRAMRIQIVYLICGFVGAIGT